MRRVELLTVAETFLLTKVGLVLMPDFPVPPRWKNKSDQVTVQSPDGLRVAVHAEFNVVHFTLGRSQTVTQRERSWRVVVILPQTAKSAVPVGSRIFVSPDIQVSLLSSTSIKL